MYKDNITLFLQEKDCDNDDDNHDNDHDINNENNENVIDIEKLIEEFESLNNNKQNLGFLNKNSEEALNSLTVNQLLKICEYYNLLKNVKIAKYKKNEIVNAITLFEIDINNSLTVMKRKKLWNYMYELSNDAMMKKYVIWK